MTRLARRAATAWLVALAALLCAPLVAHGQPTEPWSIQRYDVELRVQSDGSMDVTEHIELDFGTLQRRGILRYIPVWENLPTPLPDAFRAVVPEGREGSLMRVWRIDGIRVTSATGARTDLHIEGPEEQNGNVFIRVGHPERFISGRQQYTITYRVRGALEPQVDTGGLAWNAIGTGWPVPIERISVLLEVPGVVRATCVQGPRFATDPCPVDQGDGRVRYESAGPLGPFEGLTVSAEFASDDIDAGPIIVEDRPGLRRAMIGAPWSLPTSIAVLVAGLVGVVTLAWRQGRDRVLVGGVTSHGEVMPTERRRRLFEPRIVPVEFRPPDGLRPGQLGLIIDESVDEVDVSSTVVDLAVRGHITIVEVPKSGWFRKQDWSLAKTDASRSDLLGYEKRLLTGLFSGRDSVLVSALKGTFSDDYSAVVTGIYSDGQSRRWFAERPDQVRGRWMGVGGFLVATGGLGAFMLASGQNASAVGVAVFLVGVLLMALHRHMPHRTGKGSALLVRTLGFRQFVETAEAGRMDFAEQEQLFVEYLPYAVVFGVVDRWSKVFEDLGVDVGQAVGGFYVGSGPFRMSAFSAGMNDFSSAVGSATIQAPPSSSSGGGGFSGGGGGFSGGGGGGGGGGSW